MKNEIKTVNNSGLPCPVNKTDLPPVEIKSESFEINSNICITENDFMVLADSAPEGVFIGDHHFQTVYMNNQLKECLDLPSPRAGLPPISEFLDQTDVDDYSKNYSDVMRGLKKGAEMNIRIRSKNGQLKLFRALMSRISWNGPRHYVLNILRNEPEDTNAMAICQKVLNAYPYIALLINEDGHILCGNKILADRFGCDISEILNHTIYDYLPADVARARKQKVDKAIAIGQAISYQDYNNKLYLDHFISPIKDANGKFSTVAIFIKDITGYVQAENAIKALSRKLITAIEEERKKIACDLHDECSQLVSVISMGLTSFRETLPEDLPQIKSVLTDYLKIIERLGLKIRRISSGLHPDMIDNLGLVPAIKWYIETFFKNTPGILYEFKTNYKDKNLGNGMDIVLYRIIQESLSNILKHAHARQIRIILNKTDKAIILVIQDDGTGFDIKDIFHPNDDKKDCMGILIMRERAASIGGKLLIGTAPGKGTTVKIIIPAKKDRQ
ncbi:MAG: PAS domain-containing protein [Proteobacteria bacterium]|nr:PAS domain-containing protein [Pseudomonadota bacterium]